MKKLNFMNILRLYLWPYSPADGLVVGPFPLGAFLFENLGGSCDLLRGPLLPSHVVGVLGFRQLLLEDIVLPQKTRG